MMRSFIAIVGVIFLAAGCSSTVEKSDSGPYAPKATGPATGTVSYNPDGAAEIVQVRRNSALKTIFENCGNSNEYTIDSEETIKAQSGLISNLGASRERLLHYQCSKK